MKLEDAVLAIAPMTIGEMRYGALVKGWGPDRMKRLEHHLQTFEVLPVDGEVGVRFSNLFLASRRAGRDKGMWNGCVDLWIAATADRYGLPLATLDTGFEGIPGIRLIGSDGVERFSSTPHLNGIAPKDQD